MYDCFWTVRKGVGECLEAAFQYLQESNQESRAKLFTQMLGGRKDNSYKLNWESLWDLSPWRFSGCNWITLSNLLWFQCWPCFEEGQRPYKVLSSLALPWHIRWWWRLKTILKFQYWKKVNLCYMPVLKTRELALFIVTTSKALLRNGKWALCLKEVIKNKGLYLRSWLRSRRLGKLIPIYS